MKHKLLSVMIVAMLANSAVSAQDIRRAPPEVREEMVPEAREGYIWAPGYWRWQHHHYVWVQGYWEAGEEDRYFEHDRREREHQEHKGGRDRDEDYHQEREHKGEHQSNDLSYADRKVSAKASVIERFESVAEDASVPGSSYIGNSWGLHQPRITRHLDGSIRIIYLSTGENNALRWRLMYRSPSGGWRQEASGLTTDDVVLLRDARNDHAYVIAWPNSVPTVYASPYYSGSAIPGSWQRLPASSRHYGNAGIGTDGTICLKVSRELPVLPQTSTTNTEYSCGKFSETSNTWKWSNVVSHPIGLRHSYDYIFPNPEGLPKGMYATATRDLHKAASEVPNQDPSYGNYVFNGIRFYFTGLYSDREWNNIDTKIPFSRITRASAAPVLRLSDSLIDSKERFFSAYYTENSSNPEARGFYVTVNDSAGSTIFQNKWKNLPLYGAIRIFEDARNRLWLLWINQGKQATQVRLYPIIESFAGAAPSFSLGDYTDISADFNPYVTQGNLYLAVPRGGNKRSLYIDAIYNACSTTYQHGVNFDSKSCYSNSGQQRIFYVHIRLPE